MSGHSKWSTIKRKKGAEDAKRGKIFTRLAREITMAARQGGGDADTNPTLRLAIDKARASNMPKDNIQRAIARGTGEGDDVDALEEITYEGYAPSGIAVLVDCVTDNKNRTLAEVKHIFSKSGGNLASAGSVMWQFDQKGYISIAADGVDFDEVFMVAAEAGAEDVELEDDEISIYTPREDAAAVADAVREAGYKIDEFQLTWVAKNEVSLDTDDALKVMNVIEKLEDLDDVQNVSSNLDITDEALEALSAA
ncbi:MAG: YebC/PmpR family DNA-binding transcriptional regulator [Anaerolineae bacterium]|nr:YebC/PmpR family DNA-binding transcriptional regulator [Anaerolineae bacterium]